jgi:hypothetical protein
MNILNGKGYEQEKRTIQVKLLHPKAQIYWSNNAKFITVFWWNGDRNKIAYHYKSESGGRVQYLKTPPRVTKRTHNILSYCEDTNSLVLKDRKAI